MISKSVPPSIAGLRRRAKRRIQNLSPNRLQVADDFPAYLEERESNEATDELLNMPGLSKEFDKAKKDIAAGRSADWRKVRDDV
jgi:hypothetical protein